MKENIIIAKVYTVTNWDKDLLIRFEYNSSKKNQPDYIRISKQKIKEVLFASNIIDSINEKNDFIDIINQPKKYYNHIEAYLRGKELCVRQFRIKDWKHYCYSFAGFAENKRFVIFEKIKK